MRARQFIEQADAAEASGDLAGALAAVEAALALDPARARWQHRLGRLRDRRRDWSGAAAAFAVAARLDPDRPSRWARLGRARQKCWDLAGACQAYATAVELAPDRPEWAERLAAAEQALVEFRPFSGLVIAHRGRSHGRAENAVESLAQLPPLVAGVEVDVRLTRDGVPVLMHDVDVARTTTGAGEVAELTNGQVGELRGAGGVRVPTLAGYLAASAGRGFQRILVDVKSPDPATLAAVASTVDASPVAGECVVMVRGTTALAEFRRQTPTLRLGSFGTTVDNVELHVAAARRHGAELLLVALGGRRYLANRDVIDRVRAAGLLAGASTINGHQALEAARIDQCDLIMTDLSHQLTWYAGGQDSIAPPA